MIALGAAAMLVCACGSEPPAQSAADGVATASKIAFDLSRVNEEGLIGPPSGLRALSYAFCIPARAEAVATVERLDATVRISAESPGRIGCGADEALCIGHTHQANWRSVLESLAALEFVARIEEWVGE